MLFTDRLSGYCFQRSSAQLNQHVYWIRTVLSVKLGVVFVGADNIFHVIRMNRLSGDWVV